MRQIEHLTSMAEGEGFEPPPPLGWGSTPIRRVEELAKDLRQLSDELIEIAESIAHGAQLRESIEKEEILHAAESKRLADAFGVDDELNASYYNGLRRLGRYVERLRAMREAEKELISGSLTSSAINTINSLTSVDSIVDASVLREHLEHGTTLTI